MYHKLLEVLGSSTKGKFFKIAILLFISMILEILGIGLLIPVLKIFFGEKNEIFSIFTEFIGLDYNSKNLIVIFIFFFFVRTLLIVLITYYQNNFVAKIIKSLGYDMMKGYLYADFEFHSQNNSSNLLKNILVEIHYLSDYLFALVLLLVESFLAFGIVFTLLIIEPTASIITISFIFIFSIILNFILKPKINFWGKKREKLDSLISKTVNENINAYKEIRFTNSMEFFLNKFDMYYLPKSKIYTYQKTVAVVPRFFLELIAVLSILTFTLYMYFSGKPESEILIKTGIFIAGAFRLLPSISRIISSYQRLNFFKSSVETLYSQVLSLKKFKENYLQKFAIEKIKTLQLDSISFKYPKSKTKIFNKFNFEINEKQIVGVLGESGSGKSTLINIISGLLKQDEGEYIINGKIVKDPIKIGYLPQDVYLMDESIKKNIAFGIEDQKIDEKKIFKVLKMTNSLEFVRTLKAGIDTVVGERGSNFSGGQIKRLALSRALYFEPSILVLDEVTSGLDYENALSIMNLLQNLKSKIPIIITTHDKSQIKFCDKIFNLK